MEMYLGTINGITSNQGVLDVLELISNIYGQIDSSKIIIDLGSSDGSAIDSFRRNSGVNRAIGIEFVKDRYDKSVEKYPDCEFHLSNFLDKKDLISEADIIFMNDICFLENTFWDIFDSIKTGAVVVYNKISHTPKLINKYGYDRKTEIHKVVIDSNNMYSEYHAIIKK